MKKLTAEEVIDRILRENADLFKNLADGVVCAACGRVAYGDKANLGADYHWAEGHFECAPKASGAI